MESISAGDLHPGPPPVNSISTLLANLIDYAGLSPPASLDMATTVANYASYLASDDAWLLERLIIPVSRLDEFDQHAAAHLPKSAEMDPWPISALTRPAEAEDLPDDLDRIAVFSEKHSDPQHGLALIDVIELKAQSPDAIDDAIDVIPVDLYPFFEMPINDDPRGLIAALVGGEAGAKVRTGGVTTDPPPSAADLARFIAACAAADVPFKATGGLHHPLPRTSPAVNAHEHGFLNVFIAATLVLNAGLDEARLVALLEDDDIKAFVFDDDGLTWRDHRITTDEIEDTRLAFAVSFTSCSFDEPLAALRALGLL